MVNAILIVFSKSYIVVVVVLISIKAVSDLTSALGLRRL